VDVNGDWSHDQLRQTGLAESPNMWVLFGHLRWRKDILWRMHWK